MIKTEDSGRAQVVVTEEVREVNWGKFKCLIYFIFKDLFYVHECSVCIYLCTTYMPDTYRGQKSASDLPVLELQRAVRGNVLFSLTAMCQTKQEVIF